MAAVGMSTLAWVLDCFRVATVFFGFTAKARTNSHGVTRLSGRKNDFNAKTTQYIGSEKRRNEKEKNETKKDTSVPNIQDL